MRPNDERLASDQGSAEEANGEQGEEQAQERRHHRQNRALRANEGRAAGATEQRRRRGGERQRADGGDKHFERPEPVAPTNHRGDHTESRGGQHGHHEEHRQTATGRQAVRN